MLKPELTSPSRSIAWEIPEKTKPFPQFDTETTWNVNKESVFLSYQSPNKRGKTTEKFLKVDFCVIDGSLNLKFDLKKQQKIFETRWNVWKSIFFVDQLRRFNYQNQMGISIGCITSGARFGESFILKVSVDSERSWNLRRINDFGTHWCDLTDKFPLSVTTQYQFSSWFA